MSDTGTKPFISGVVEGEQTGTCGPHLLELRSWGPSWFQGQPFLCIYLLMGVCIDHHIDQ